MITKNGVESNYVHLILNRLMVQQRTISKQELKFRILSRTSTVSGFPFGQLESIL